MRPSTLLSSRRALGALAASALVLGACGSEADDSSDESDDTLLDLDEVDEEAAEQGVTALAAALARTSEATAFHIDMAMGMTMSMAGQDLSFEADPSAPMMFFDVDAEGQQYSRVDMSSMMDQLMGSTGAGIDLGDLVMEMWIDGSTMTVDMTSFSTMLDGAGMGALSDEPFTVDASRLPGVTGADVASAVTGQAMPDPSTLADVLSGALGDAAETGPDTYSGTLTFAEYSAAFGQDATAALGGLGDQLDAVLGGDAGEMADGLAAAFETVEVGVEVSIADDAVDVVAFDIDMMPVMSAMFDAFGESDMAGSEIEMFEAMLDGAEFETQIVMDYTIDPSIDVVVPEGDFPDRTDEFLSGFGSQFN